MIPLDSYNFKLTVAGGPFKISRTGRFLRCTESDEAFVLAVDGQEVPFKAGQSIAYPLSYEPFEQLQIKRASGAALATNNVTLIVGDVVFGDDRVQFSGNISLIPGTVITPKVAVRLSSPSADVALVADTNTQIFTANADAESVEVYNSGTVPVRLATLTGDLSGTRGLIVPPNTSRIIRQNGNLFARAIGGVATISVNFTAFA